MSYSRPSSSRSHRTRCERELFRWWRVIIRTLWRKKSLSVGAGSGKGRLISLGSGGAANVVRQTLRPLEHGRKARLRFHRQVAAEAVAPPTHGPEQVPVAGGPDGPAQAPHVPVDRSLLDVDGVAP